MANPNPNLGNLRPAWTSETAPRQPGRKNAGLSLLEWVNEMASWRKDEVQCVADNENEPIIKRRAAERLLDKGDAWNVVNQTNGSAIARTQTEVTQRYVRTIRLPANDNGN